MQDSKSRTTNCQFQNIKRQNGNFKISNDKMQQKFLNIERQNANSQFVKSQFAKSQNVNLVVLIIFKCKNIVVRLPTTKFSVQKE